MLFKLYKVSTGEGKPVVTSVVYLNLKKVVENFFKTCFSLVKREQNSRKWPWNFKVDFAQKLLKVIPPKLKLQLTKPRKCYPENICCWNILNT